MSVAVLYSNNLIAGANTNLYPSTANTQAAISLSICNRGNEIVLLRASISNNAIPQLSEYVEFDTQIGPSSVFERTGLIIPADKILIIRSDKANVSAVCYGYTDSTI